ncbi:Heme-binding protein (nitrite reductase protein N) [gamma proteobacterium HdN1]|nr:Heme-binding protein (nitrite reductase protein N) [gamma proteobacterium HdN1]
MKRIIQPVLSGAAVAAMLAGVLFWSGLAAASEAAPNASALFQEHCASCHGKDRVGLMGPALLPENLERLRKPVAAETIRKGRTATQMPAFSEVLSEGDINALVDYIFTEPANKPVWTEKEIVASHSVDQAALKLPAKPVFAADPHNLFLVVEAGDHHVSILDGDKLEVIHRFASRFALHGGPKYSTDGRFVYFASRDGWITKYDLWNLRVVAEIRAGLNARNLAVSDDGKWVLVGNYLPRTAVLLDASDLSLQRVYNVADAKGQPSRVSAVYDAAPRKSFILALKDVPLIWEISYDPQAEPVHRGYVHDYKMGEAIAEPGLLTPRAIELDRPLDDFYFDPSYNHVMGASRSGHAEVIDLRVRRKVADLELGGMPHLGSGITFEYQGRPVMATTNLGTPVVTVIDMNTWKKVTDIPANGTGFFLRSHDKTPYMWVDAMMNPSHRDTLQIIDKRSLKVVGSVTPEKGLTSAHVEFTRDGKYALVSLMEMKGAIVVYDAATFKEIKRLPMVKPVGKYNVWNKVSRDQGTSH